MRKYIFLTLAFILFFTGSHLAFASYNATDVIGQVDSSGNPVFTSGLSNNSQNPYGMRQPHSEVVDSIHHRLFLAESGASRILIYNLDSNNRLVHNYPDAVLGQPNLYDHINGTASANTIPSDANIGVAYDPVNDRLFVNDYNRLLVFNTSTITNGMAASYVLGQPDFVSFAANQGGSASATTMNTIRGVAYDSVNSRLFVGDKGNNRILEFDLSGGITNDMAATYIFGGQVQSLSYDSNDQVLFASNAGVQAYDVRPNGSSSQNLCGNPGTGIANNETAQCSWSGITNSGTSNFSSTTYGEYYDNVSKLFFVSDPGNSRVLMFDFSSGIPTTLTAIHVFGQSNYTNISSGTTQSTFSGSLRNLFYDSTTHLLYVADAGNNRFMIFDLSGTITDGMNASNELGNNDPTTGAPLYTQSFVYNETTNNQGLSYYGPSPSVVDPVNHRLYVSDQGGGGSSDPGNRVLVFNLDSNNNLIDHTADYVLGQSLFTANSCNQGGSVAANTLCTPQGVAFDSSTGYLYVADSGNNRVLVFNTSALATNMNATYVIGQGGFTTNGVADTQAGMRTPRELTIDSGHHVLYVSEGNRVESYDMTTLTNTGQNALHILGQSGYGTNVTNNGGTAANTAMNAPEGVSYDATHKYLYVSDTSNNRVLQFDLSGTITDGMAASNVIGQTAFGNNSTGTSSTTLNAPFGIAYDSNQNMLFVADESSSRVLGYPIASLATNMAATIVIGQNDFVSFAEGVTASNLMDAVSLSYDASSNKLYISDHASRLLIFSFPSLPTTTLTSTYGGTLPTISASNTQGTVTYSLISGTLPPGVTLSSTGFTGTPTDTVMRTFTLQATDTVSGNGTFLSLPTVFTWSVNGTATPTVTSTGGGGGISYPKPIGPFSISLNNGAPTTTNPTVTVSITQSLLPAITSMALSTDPTFSNASIIPYTPTTTFTLTTQGTNTVYARLYTPEGMYSDTADSSIVLGSATTQPSSSSTPDTIGCTSSTAFSPVTGAQCTGIYALLPSSGSSTHFTFTEPVGVHSIKSLIIHLQTALNIHLGNALTPQLIVDGVYGRKTIAAIKQFQSINGLTVDGIVGHKTYTLLSY